MRFLNQQNRLAEILGPDSKEKCREILSNNQNMVLGLIDTLEAQKKRNEKAQIDDLLNKLQGLERQVYSEAPKRFFHPVGKGIVRTL